MPLEIPQGQLRGGRASTQEGMLKRTSAGMKNVVPVRVAPVRTTQWNSNLPSVSKQP